MDYRGILASSSNRYFCLLHKSHNSKYNNQSKNHFFGQFLSTDCTERCTIHERYQRKCQVKIIESILYIYLPFNYHLLLCNYLYVFEGLDKQSYTDGFKLAKLTLVYRIFALNRILESAHPLNRVTSVQRFLEKQK